MMAARALSDMPTLKQLVEGFVEVADTDDTRVSAVCIDSRRVNPGDLFIALPGTRASGVDFMPEAVERGAAAILVDSGSEIQAGPYPVPVYSVPDLKFKTGLIAGRFYNHPSRELNIIGITGTNGKTSVCHFLGQALSRCCGPVVGTIGTLGHGIFGKPLSGNNTTPDAVTVHGLLSRFRDERAREVVMEVSSHALDQGRVSGVRFKTAVFTNLSHDHLDYHGDMKRYAGAKQRLFFSEGLQNSVINLDDPAGRELAERLQGRHRVIGYGLVEDLSLEYQPQLAVRAVVVHEDMYSHALNISSPWGEAMVQVNLPGTFNSYNVLAVLSVLCLHGVEFSTALKMLAGLRSVPGRMELFCHAESARIFVDYAHTPDSLAQTLSFLRRQCSGKLICVFGCGGDRDKTKRPQMGRVAGELADHLILTTDNPRNEPPGKIIRDIVSGISEGVSYEIEPDRRLAICSAIRMAGCDDVILVAGKGHELYQEAGLQKTPFNDRQVVEQLLEEFA